jgi:Rps23 Pro-64 3,4-dihydroxylase Tpa1-like proline 4-hydroxylase
MADARKSSDRLLSAVYYFHAEPKAFSGRELRLHSFAGDGSFVDVPPEQNSLVVPVMGIARSAHRQLPIEALLGFTF